MKKGFTLVELLAVIVILAIIAIITIPMISNVIEKSKLGAMEDSAYGLIEAANYYYAEHMNEMSSNKLFVIENGTQTSEEKLNYKGKIEGNAKVLLASNGKVALCLTNGKSYVKKEITDTKVVMNTVSSDTTCEINGLESEEDITIDISGGNSSYYNKNEIDDKLNDIRNDLENYVTKDEFNDSLKLDYSNASPDVQDINTLLQNLLNKFYPLGFDFLKDTLQNEWSSSDSSIYNIEKTSSYLNINQIKDYPDNGYKYQIKYNNPVEITGDTLTISGLVRTAKEGNAGTIVLTTTMYIQISFDNSNWTTISNTFSSTKTAGTEFSQDIDISSYRGRKVYFRVYIYNSWMTGWGYATFNTFKIS